MSTTKRPIAFAGSELRETRHVCAFFNSDEEEYRVLLPFIHDGITCGDKAVHVVNHGQEHAHRERLQGAGVDVAGAQQSGQLKLRSNAETYLRDGRFDAESMLAAFERMASNKGDYSLSRIVCRMDWAASNPMHVPELIEFEARVNDVWRRHDDAVICTYHLPKFSGDVIMDIMRTHPMIILGGILQYNPFFVPPEELLPQLHERRRTS